MTPPCFCLMIRIPRRYWQASASQQLHLVYVSHGPRQSYIIWALALVLLPYPSMATSSSPCVYLDSIQSSGGYCWQDMKRRIGLAASAMSSLHRIWNDKCLSVPTKIHLFQAVVLSVLLSASETWTVRVTDMKTPEDFYLKCHRQILGVRWHEHVTNSEILSHAGVGPLAEQIACRCTAAFGHITRLADNVPARLTPLSDRRNSRPSSQ